MIKHILVRSKITFILFLVVSLLIFIYLIKNTVIVLEDSQNQRCALFKERST